MKTQKRYWLCQILGWGGLMALFLFIAYKFGSDNFFTPATKRNLLLYGFFTAFISYI
jgi:hypothetical protein